ncbi:MAG: ABC transporter permease subunit [Pseudoclavibacter sp.]
MADTASASATAVRDGTGTGAVPEPAQRVERIHAQLRQRSEPNRVRPVLLATGILAWIVFALLAVLLPNNSNLPMSETGATDAANPFTFAAGLAIAVVWLAIWALSATSGRGGAWARQRASHGAAWLLASAVWLLVWELTTAKTGLLQPPYYPSPQQILNGLSTDRALLASSTGNSLLLLAVGFIVGLAAGLLTGVTIGWFQLANYWVHPVLILIGPIPAVAWVPIVFTVFPSAYSGAVFIIALSVWFPITVLTRAGILSVPRSYYDVAQTLGAKSWFLVLRVSLPSALPSIFTGAFMALGASFASLVVAENFGVNSGLGWYLNFKKSWGDFPGLYGGLIVLAVICALLLTLLFWARNRVLRWEKELTRW